MYNPRQLQTAFSGLVGLRQPNIPLGIPEISAPLSNSLSGVYVDDKNPLVATENLYYSAPNFDVNVYPLWVSGRNYSKGIAVNSLGILYISLFAITADVVPPASDTTNWAPYNPFQSWLLQKYNQAVTNLFAEVVKRKKLLHMGKEILERQQLYRGFGSVNEKIIPQGRFVGFQIMPQQAEGLWVFIDKVGIQSTSANPAMKYYLYHSTELDFLDDWYQDLTLVNTFSWQDLVDGDGNLNCVMKYLKQNTSGVYFFGYYEDDLTGQAISKNWNCMAYPCAGCDGVDLGMYNQWSRYTTLRNISVPASALNEDRTLFDTSKIVYDSLTNWGLNLSITVRCNLTDFIIYSKYLYTDAFAMQLCKEYLEAIAKGIRIGPNPAQTKLSAIADLDPKSPGNWLKSYNDSIDALNLDMSGFSSSCMPCDQKNKIKFFSI